MRLAGPRPQREPVHPQPVPPVYATGERARSRSVRDLLGNRAAKAPPVPLRQNLAYCRAPPLGRRMGVPHRHRGGLVPHEVLDGPEVHALREQGRREGVAERVPADRGEGAVAGGPVGPGAGEALALAGAAAGRVRQVLRDPQTQVDPAASPVERGVVAPEVAAHPDDGTSRDPVALQDVHELGADLDAGVAVGLGRPDEQDLTVPVDVLGLEAVELGAAEAGQGREGDGDLQPRPPDVLQKEGDLLGLEVLRLLLAQRRAAELPDEVGAGDAAPLGAGPPDEAAALADEHLDRPRPPVRVVRHVADEERPRPLVHRDVGPGPEEGLEPGAAHLDRGRPRAEALLVEVGVERVERALERRLLRRSP